MNRCSSDKGISGGFTQVDGNIPSSVIRIVRIEKRKLSRISRIIVRGFTEGEEDDDEDDDDEEVIAGVGERDGDVVELDEDEMEDNDDGIEGELL